MRSGFSAAVCLLALAWAGPSAASPRTPDPATATVLPILPDRASPATVTSGKVPHVQIDVPLQPALVDALLDRAFLLPDVARRPTIVSLPGSWGIFLTGDAPIVDRSGVVRGREFAHIHPDGSLHLPLPPERLAEAAKKGWVERHPWIGSRDGFHGLVMLFSPRSAGEVEVVLQLIVDSYNHVTGRTVELAGLGSGTAD